MSKTQVKLNLPVEATREGLCLGIVGYGNHLCSKGSQQPIQLPTNCVALIQHDQVTCHPQSPQHCVNNAEGMMVVYPLHPLARIDHRIISESTWLKI